MLWHDQNVEWYICLRTTPQFGSSGGLMTSVLVSCPASRNSWSYLVGSVLKDWWLSVRSLKAVSYLAEYSFAFCYALPILSIFQVFYFLSILFCISSKLLIDSENWYEFDASSWCCLFCLLVLTIITITSPCRSGN